MAEIRVTQEELVVEAVNVDAKIRATQAEIVAEVINASALARVTQEDLIVEAINASALCRVSQAVFIGVLQRPTAPVIREMITPMVNNDDAA